MQHNDLLDDRLPVEPAEPSVGIAVPDGIRVLTWLLLLTLQLGVTIPSLPSVIGITILVPLYLLVIACLLLVMHQMAVAARLQDHIIRWCQVGFWGSIIGFLCAPLYMEIGFTDEVIVDEQRQQMGALLPY